MGSELLLSNLELLRNAKKSELHCSWIHAWNIWVYLIREEIKPLIPDLEIAGVRDTVSALVLNDKTFAVPVEELHLRFPDEDEDGGEKKNPEKSKEVANKKRIDEICYLLEFWAKIRYEGLNCLFCAQIALCEHKTQMKRLGAQERLLLELIKESLAEKIILISRIEDDYVQDLKMEVEIWADGKGEKDFNKLAIICPEVEKAVGMLHDRENMEEIRWTTNSTNCTITFKKPMKWCPDFHHKLFGGRKTPAMNSYESLSFLKNLQKYFDRIMNLVIVGFEWYMYWKHFIDSVLESLSKVLDNPTEYVFMNSYNKKQIAIEQKIFERIVWIQKNKNVDHHSVLEVEKFTKCIYLLDELIYFIELSKLENNLLIKHIETKMRIYLKIEDLNRPPKDYEEDEKTSNLYQLRNVVLSKNRTIVASLEYLYKEMIFCIDFTEIRYHMRQDYDEKFGRLTRNLMKKYNYKRKTYIRGMKQTQPFDEDCDNTPLTFIEAFEELMDIAKSGHNINKYPHHFESNEEEGEGDNKNDLADDEEIIAETQGAGQNPPDPSIMENIFKSWSNNIGEVNEEEDNEEDFFLGQSIASSKFFDKKDENEPFESHSTQTSLNQMENDEFEEKMLFGPGEIALPSQALMPETQSLNGQPKMTATKKRPKWRQAINSILSIRRRIFKRGGGGGGNVSNKSRSKINKNK